MVRWGAGGYLRINAGLTPVSSGGSNDPFFSSVVLLALNDNQPNGTTTFVDQSSTLKTITRVGSAVYSTDQFPTGMSTVGKFTTSTWGLSVSASTDFSFAGDFTWEGMGWSTAWPGFAALFAPHAFGGGDGNFYVQSNRLSIFNISSSFLGTQTVSTSTWHHLAVVRSGTTITGFIDGVATDSPLTSAATLGSAVNAAGVANDLAAGDGSMGGYVCCVRVTRAARYTANFTPPTLPLPTS